MSELRDRVLRNGYLVADAGMTWDDFLLASEDFGPVLFREDVRLYRSKRGVHQPAGLGFHTDYPGARFVGWWCVWQDEQGGVLDLVDGRLAASRVSAASASRLRDTNIVGFGRDPLPSVHWPLLFHTPPDATQYINYNPFGVPASPHHDTTSALLEFRLALREQFNETGVSIRLQPRQALWIDNWRMLHGRAALTADSGRFLKRLWLDDLRAPRPWERLLGVEAGAGPAPTEPHQVQ